MAVFFPTLKIHMPSTASAASLCLLGICVLSCGDGGTGPKPVGQPAAVQVVSGDAQQGVVGQELPQPLVVKVVDAGGRPVGGHVVNFRVTSGGGSVFGGASSTNAQGIAQERWTIGTAAGAPQRLEVRAVDSNTGQAIVFGTFNATALPGSPDSAIVVGGDGQSGEAGAALPTPLEIRVADKYGNAVPAATVSWSVTLGGGTVSAATTVTDVTGVARVSWTLGTAVGSNALSATVGSLPALAFAAQSGAGAATALQLVRGGGQTGQVGRDLQPVVVRATDRHGNPAIVSVTFTASGDGIFFPATAVTDSALGQASALWRLGSVAGTQTGTITASGLTLTVSAIGTPGQASTIVIVSGDGQTGTASQPLPQPLVVRVADSYGNVLGNVAVAFAASSGCGSVSPNSASTDGAGLAQTQWTLGASGAGCAGGVTATITSHGAAVRFTALVTGSSAASISAGNYTDLVGSIGAPTQLFVFLKDGAGNGVPGLTVTWTLTSGTGSFSSPTSVTDALGVAGVTFTPGTVAGNNTVSASVSGVGSAGYLVWTKAGNPVRIVRLGGDGQTGSVGHPLPDSLRVRVEDQYGNGVYQQSVRFAVAAGSGYVERTTLTTDTLGNVSTRWITSALGAATATATWNGTLVSFSATATAHSGDGVVIVSGNEQSVAAHASSSSASLPYPLVARVIDGQGNPVVGAQVTWTAPYRTTLDTTDANGESSTTVQVPSFSAGIRSVTARIASGSVANFTAISDGANTTIRCSPYAGSDQSGRVGTRLAAPILISCFSNVGWPGSYSSLYTGNAGQTQSGGTVLPAPGYRRPGEHAVFWVMPSQPGIYYLWVSAGGTPNFATATATP